MKENQSRVEPTRKAAAGKASPKTAPASGIPAILFEGDEPEGMAPSREAKYSTGTPASTNAPAEPRELPEAYGTGHLLLLPHDPHTLYAHWDLDQRQLEQYAALSGESRLRLRLHLGEAAGAVATELLVEPGSQHQFVSVSAPATTYVAELGYSSASQGWVSISTSAAVKTPPATVSSETEVRFGRVPVSGEQPEEASFQPAPAVVPGQSPPTIPPRIGWIPVLGIVPASAISGSDEGTAVKPEIMASTLPTERISDHSGMAEWSAAQERALAEMLAWPQSLLGPSSLEYAQPPSSVEVASSPLGEINAPKEFWLNVNADLIIYGATEPTAQVKVAGSPVELRGDGTFACRFALPDGEYQVSVGAVSKDGDSRSISLKFQRQTVVDSLEQQRPALPSLPQA